MREAILGHLRSMISDPQPKLTQFRLDGTEGIRAGGWTPAQRTTVLGEDGIDVVISFGDGIKNPRLPNELSLVRDMRLTFYGPQTRTLFNGIEETSWNCRRALDGAKIPFSFQGSVNHLIAVLFGNMGAEHYGAPGELQYPKQVDLYTISFRLQR